MRRDFSIVIRGLHMVFPDGERAADLGLEGETIGAVGPHGALSGDRVIDVADLLVMPGAVDTHIHINEPGRTEWEGFVSATRAAAAGGVTTLVDMPLNSAPVTTTREAFALKQSASEGKLSVDVGFWGGIVPGNAGELEGLIDAGVLGFKCFMVHSGIDDFPAVDEPTLRTAMGILSKQGKPILAHAERNVPPASPNDRRSPRAWAASRPPACEVEAVELLVRLARETGCATHVVHVAAAEVLPVIASAQKEGLPITAETCPHYLLFCEENIPEGATQYKCAPPIRDARNRDALWEGLRSGILTMVVSDHSPCPPAMKGLDTGDFFNSWGGIASIQVGLPAILTEATRRKISPGTVSGWMSKAPAHLAGLSERKGVLAPGHDADLVLVDVAARTSVIAERLEHRHPVTPYDRFALTSTVRQTWLRGQRVYDYPAVVQTGSGRILRSK